MECVDYTNRAELREQVEYMRGIGAPWLAGQNRHRSIYRSNYNINRTYADKGSVSLSFLGIALNFDLKVETKFKLTRM